MFITAIEKIGQEWLCGYRWTSFWKRSYVRNIRVVMGCEAELPIGRFIRARPLFAYADETAGAALDA